jgi:hypothetical protein
MEGPLFSLQVLINKEANASALVDEGCTSFCLIDERFATKLCLPRIPVSTRQSETYEGPASANISEMVYFHGDIGGISERLFAYVVPKIVNYNIILGKRWKHHVRAYVDPDTDRLVIRSHGISIPNSEKSPLYFECKEVSAAAYNLLSRGRRRRKMQTFAASLVDIQKALRVKKPTDPKTKLPAQYHQWLKTFSKEEAGKLPPYRGEGIDHAIQLEKTLEGKEPEVPWGPLYSMSRDELLVLRKMLTDLLDKGFIRVSNSPAAAPVLFVRKPGGGLRFCVDYRALNRITRKDRYPLPLIQETLNTISKAKWFTKLDVSAAFHRIRIKEGDEWKTAFRTRFGLYEWLVTPFGLVGAPSTFQRYINWILRDCLDEFCSAYIDDVLIYTDGSKKQHEEHVKKILTKMDDAGLQLDIDKCEFSVTSTKYLGFYIEAGKGLRMDPQKVAAIREWNLPTSIKGVQGFLGFANFYRRFIHKFSELARPLTALTKKENVGQPFVLNREAQTAIEALKEAFITAPMLAQWDPDRETQIETDASGYCSGGTLMQKDDEGFFRPVAYYSKRHLPAECNYEIYDKEMLAIIQALVAWRSELKSVTSFKILTDHKNLEYFMTTRKLTERQMRWSLMLSEFNFTIAYRPGNKNDAADALSRREQDAPTGEDDDRQRLRHHQLLRDDQIEGKMTQPIARIAPARVTIPTATPQSIEDQWVEAVVQDKQYQQAKKCVAEQARVFPREVGLRVAIADCSVEQDRLCYRDRFWVPDSEPLRTRILQTTHDSYLTGHPGKEGMSAILRRRYFWPNMHTDVKRFVRNCHSCGAHTVWRDRKKGLLRPLPVPERIWSEISMDYITELPRTPKGNRHILVIVDRLSKGTIFIPCKDLTGETLAKKMLKYYLPHHLLPAAITSDRGDQFVQGVWGHLCKLLKIEQRLSSAYHPETDGSTERMNQTLEEYLRHFGSYYQDDWDRYLPLAQAAIMTRDATSTGVSPFFTNHGFHPRTGTEIDIPAGTSTPRNPIEAAQSVIAKLKSVQDFTQTSMTFAQQTQQEVADRKRDPAPTFQVGDRAWLDLRNVTTDRPKKKLAELHAQFTVTEVISGSAYRLNVPTEIHDVFHVSLLRPVASDPLPSQKQTDPQPPAVLVDNEQEYELEEILDVRIVRGRGRGGPLKRQLLCKWKGYQAPSWTDAVHCHDTKALDDFELRTGRCLADEPLALPPS